MNNYSWIQRKTHSLALSSQIMREFTFDMEMLCSQKIKFSDDHVFIAGLARSGTTALLNAIFSSNEFASLSYADMPFVLSPNLWSKLNRLKKHEASIERAHGDGIHISTDSPEAFEEVFWGTFHDHHPDTHEKFKNYVCSILIKGNKERYLSKNNQNIVRLQEIKKIFPKSHILIPFRDPAQHVLSLYNQHIRFLEMSKKDPFVADYMNWIGHKEFGPGYVFNHSEDLRFRNHLDFNHWLEQWLLVYSKILETEGRNNGCEFICYESICSGELAWNRIRERLCIKKNYVATFVESKQPLNLNFHDKLLTDCRAVYAAMLDVSI